MIFRFAPVTCTLDRAADARIGSPPLESQGVLMDGSEREDGRESTYTYLLERKCPYFWVGLEAGLDPDGGRWRQIVAGGLDAMDQVNALFG